MDQEAAYFFHEQTLKYRFNDRHPFNQKRLILTHDLLHQANALEKSRMIQPRTAEEKELLWIHKPDYIEAVKALSEPAPDPHWISKAGLYGLHTEDTPYFVNMHEVTSTIVGGSVEAAEWVMSGKGKHALHLGGGLHHALSNKAAGFCVYNDASIAIASIRERYKARVLYIDTDVHHGDGVQWSFYTDPEVCTFSIHETGKYIFPGTGATSERGEAGGYGACFNMPVESFTEDESWMDCFHEMTENIIARCKPDVIVSQHGCDAHMYDPLSHIHCSMQIYAEMPLRIHQLAHHWCEGRWIALGGGGYDIWRVVPRAWSLLWLVMTDHPLISDLQRDPGLRLPKKWIEKWQRQSPVALPLTWLDEEGSWDPIPRRLEITQTNHQTKQVALRDLL